jgi:hypothetical protein
MAFLLFFFALLPVAADERRSGYDYMRAETRAMRFRRRTRRATRCTGLEWQAVGSLQRRLRNCLPGIRAETPPFGAQELVELELFLMWRANGMRLETAGGQALGWCTSHFGLVTKKGVLPDRRPGVKFVTE